MELPLKLVLAIIAIESGGNEFACGDGGEAYGILQLHKEYVQDAAQFSGFDWTHENAWDPIAAVAIMNAYMQRYATPQRLLRDVTAEDIARIHNGGPQGHVKESTTLYWKKVQAELIRIGAEDLASGEEKIQL